MLDAVRTLLEQSPMLAIFAVIGLGYALGRISVGGFSLGVGAVLFAGLALGALAPKATPPGLVNSIGLVMFLYGIGIQYGKQFFAGLAGPGLKWNLLGAAGVLGAIAVALAVGGAAGLSPAYSVGIFTGSLTNTPALQAALDAAKSEEPAVGYSVAYPFGVIGPILCLFLFARFFKPRTAAAPEPPRPVEVTLEAFEGETVADLLAQIPPGVDLVAVRQGGTNRLPDPQMRIENGDGILLFGLPEGLEKARDALGRAVIGRIAKDRGSLDIARIFISSPGVAGTPLGRIAFPAKIPGKIAEVRRGDAVLLPAPGLILEYGDRVGIIAPRQDVPALRKFFGDSLKSTAEFSYVSVGLGMSLGVLLGLVPVPIPGVGSFSLGIAGGPLLVALLLGRLGRTGPIPWHIPLSANLTLRNFGLTLFLAGVGLGAGKPFVETLATSGLTSLGVGVAVVLGGVGITLLAGEFLFRMGTDEIFGVVSAVGSNPAILACANREVQSDRVDVAFATVFPTATILKILCAQVAIGLMGGPGP